MIKVTTMRGYWKGQMLHQPTATQTLQYAPIQSSALSITVWP